MSQLLIQQTKQKEQNKYFTTQKQGFQLIWYYCYLKYFIHNKTYNNNKINYTQKRNILFKQTQQITQKQINQLLISQRHNKQFNNRNQINNNQQQQQFDNNLTQNLQSLYSQLSINQLLSDMRKQYNLQTLQPCNFEPHHHNSLKYQQILNYKNNQIDRFFIINPEEQIQQIDKLIRQNIKMYQNTQYQQNNRQSQQTRQNNCRQSRQSRQNPQFNSIIQSLEDMLIQLYSYYLNSKNIFIIYKSSKYTNILSTLTSLYQNNNSICSSKQSTQNRLKLILTHNSSQSRLATSKDSKGSEGAINTNISNINLNNNINNISTTNIRRSFGSLKSSEILVNNNQIGNISKIGNYISNISNISNISKNNSNTKHHINKLLEREDSLIINDKNQSILGCEHYLLLENKIQDMEIIDKLAQFDGIQLWNIKYKSIPHTFVKFKKQSWTKSLNLPILHPSSPKTINQLPILPRIKKLTPGLDKLLPFVSFIKQLQKYFPTYMPSIQSIYEYNSLPYIFIQEDNGYGSWKWETNIGVLCYYVVYGNQEQNISVKKVQRWVEQHQNTLLAKIIKEMNKRQKQKNKKIKQMLTNYNMKNVNAKTNSNETDTNINININNSKQKQNKQKQSYQLGYLNTINNENSLHMLITNDQNSDLAIW